uniref:Baculoviral IAP repeat-containing protein 5 n=1 Tax=Suricata suricatta TaxID=37032 RepID=A0A673VKR8_SURSU
MGASSLPPTWQLYLKDHRISTFKNWPFLEGCACTPERMAEAGFIHCPTENEPDLAQCFFCFKELEGWEPDDDPIEEHKKHSSGCAFLSVKKQFEELTLSEFLKLDKERAKNKIGQIRLGADALSDLLNQLRDCSDLPEEQGEITGGAGRCRRNRCSLWALDFWPQI